MRKSAQTIALEEKILEFLAKKRLGGGITIDWPARGIAENIGFARPDETRKVLIVLEKLEREGKVFKLKRHVFVKNVPSWVITVGAMIIRGYRPERDFKSYKNEPNVKPQFYTNRVLDLLYNNRLNNGTGLSIRDMAQSLGWDKSSVKRILAKEIENGTIYRSGYRKGMPGKNLLYSVTLTYLKKRHFFEEYFRSK